MSALFPRGLLFGFSIAAPVGPIGVSGVLHLGRSRQ